MLLRYCGIPFGIVWDTAIDTHVLICYACHNVGRRTHTAGGAMVITQTSINGRAKRRHPSAHFVRLFFLGDIWKQSNVSR